MLIVADACPLIFLARLNHLSLLTSLFRQITVPHCIMDEVLAPGGVGSEQIRLRSFLGSCQILDAPEEIFPSKALSVADNRLLSLCCRHKADLLLTDDALVRRIATQEGIRPLGTLGVLLQSAERRLISVRKTRCLVNALIEEHGFRISIEVYETVLRRLKG
ncbi:MAG: DUF3368 domain-containing protein [Planctomycetota bacterium]|jgi:predicted nucleic acid-binding protein